MKIGSVINFLNQRGDKEQGVVTNIEHAVLSTYHFIGKRRIAMDPRDKSFYEV